jgi:hypothetical protein
MRAHRRASLVSLATLVISPAVLGVGLARGEAPSSVRRIADGGFGDRANSYAWSMAWFKGKLYVGTGRSQYCVERATLAFYLPSVGYANGAGLGISCPADPFAMRLRAEIWQFDPATAGWRRVYRSPADVPNPRAPGKRVARDIGFRGMVVHREPDGTRALYVAGVTADEYIPELARSHPPRILRSRDGESFAALRGGPGVLRTALGPRRAMGYRAMASYRGRLFVTAASGLTGDGVIVDVKHPAARKPRFVQVSPKALRVFELEVFNRRLYAGVGDPEAGYSVWKTDAASVPATFKPVVTGGAGRGREIVSVVSMHVFKRHLYVGASGWGSLWPQSELIRLDRADRWELVVGNARQVAGSTLPPISGLGDGFGNPFNVHFWRLQDHAGALYVGTNDWSWSLRGQPGLSPLITREFGFDLYATCNGRDWWTVTRNAFADAPTDYGARTMASTPAGLFIGTADHVRGTTVWQDTTRSPCRRAGGAAQARRPSAPRIGPRDLPGRTARRLSRQRALSSG